MLDKIAFNLSNLRQEQAFFIQDQSFTFGELSDRVCGIMEALSDLNMPAQSTVGLLTTDRLETYASILALWYSRLIFVPVSPSNPSERNQSMQKQAGFSFLLAYEKKETEGVIDISDLRVVETKSLNLPGKVVPPDQSKPEDFLYLLFTSGSTGVPKGVPISCENLETYISAFFSIGYDLNEADRFLQIFDFTFDVSVQSYVLPLYLGASIYTVPQEGIKFLNALKILEKHQITFAKLVPSTLQYFKPYFSRIRLPYLKYSLFSGEALPEDITQAWSECVPNAIIENHYGPTEATIDCLCYRWVKGEECAYNGIVSIGQPFKGTEALVVKEEETLAEAGEKGELWINSKQLSTGYWKNEEKNKQAFVLRNDKIYYRTGDLVFKDEGGNFFFCGRIDNQVQIQGYRVELGEVEFQINKLLTQHLVVDTYQERGVLSLVLFLEGTDTSTTRDIQRSLQQHLPAYMIPGKIIYIDHLPRTISGKTNRKALKELI